MYPLTKYTVSGQHYQLETTHMSDQSGQGVKVLKDQKKEVDKKKINEIDKKKAQQLLKSRFLENS